MNFDLEFDYAEALKRQGHKQSDVDALRSVVEKFAVVPKSITNKQVSIMMITIESESNNYINHLTFPTASFVPGLVWRG